MARDTFILGEIGNASSIELEVLDFAENPNHQQVSASFESNRRSGYSYPRRYGATQISCEVFHKTVLDGSSDELDIIYGAFRSKVYSLTQTTGSGSGIVQGTAETLGLTKLWTMDNFYYEVTLENLIERERTMFSVVSNMTFNAPRGLKVKATLTTTTLGNGGTFTWTGNIAPDCFVALATTNGSTYTINGVTIVATSTGIITLDCTRGKAWRGATIASSEVTGAFPQFLTQNTVISLTGAATVDILFRESML